MDSELQCPYCGEWVTVFIDPGGGSEQRYEEDCPVCCRTWIIAAREEEPGGFAVAVERLDDALP